jgi:exopolyphosphatase/guanosine-5'-triphosphate,3'-diphosphate pyrophosphatase
MKIGIIDVGSNTIRLVVYLWNGKKLQKQQNIKRRAQSVKYIQARKMKPMGVSVIVDTLRELLIIARANDCQDIRIFATASLRNIDNHVATKRTIEKAIGYPIDVLDGQEESLFGFEGMKRTVQLPLTGVSVDVGGGSTEITYFEHDQALATISLPLGSLNLYLQHVQDVLPSTSEMVFIRQEIQTALANVHWLNQRHVETVIGIGGSSRALMRLHQYRHAIEASIYDMSLSQDAIETYLKQIALRDADITQIMGEHLSDRLTTLWPGALIIAEVMRKVQAQTFKLSSYGVREGYFYKRVLGAYPNGTVRPTKP